MAGIDTILSGSAIGPLTDTQPRKKTTGVTPAATAEVANEAILAGLGIDTIIGKKRKLNKRYNAQTDLLGG